MLFLILGSSTQNEPESIGRSTIDYQWMLCSTRLMNQIVYRYIKNQPSKAVREKKSWWLCEVTNNFLGERKTRNSLSLLLTIISWQPETMARCAVCVIKGFVGRREALRARLFIASFPNIVLYKERETISRIRKFEKGSLARTTSWTQTDVEASGNKSRQLPQTGRHNDDAGVVQTLNFDWKNQFFDHVSKLILQ